MLYALINFLGPMYNSDGEYEGVKFSPALPIGLAGGYYHYQIDVAPSFQKTSSSFYTCHDDAPTQYGPYSIGDENTPPRLLQVSVSGCNI